MQQCSSSLATLLVTATRYKIDGYGGDIHVHRVHIWGRGENPDISGEQGGRGRGGGGLNPLLKHLAFVMLL
jgi:hypothetical protein